MERRDLSSSPLLSLRSDRRADIHWLVPCGPPPSPRRLASPCARAPRSSASLAELLPHPAASPSPCTRPPPGPARQLRAQIRRHLPSTPRSRPGAWTPVEMARRRSRADEGGDWRRGGSEGRGSRRDGRRYQLEALERAVAGNTVAFLETGAGKTLIAVLLLRAYAHRICSALLRRLPRPHCRARGPAGAGDQGPHGPPRGTVLRRDGG
nr:hypothetical protein SEVIR_9G331900v2 [Setaria viridis]TKV94983.1 hypothetical protein SEVIR_9G331900v2 [Setaria viridis]